MKSVMSMVTAVYKFVNKINGRVYIGSAIDIEKRRYWHSQLDISHCREFKNAVLEFGENNFEFVIVEPIDNIGISKRELRIKLNEKEQFYLDKCFAQEYINTKGKDRRFRELTYNINPKASGCAGYKWTEDAIQRRKEYYKTSVNPMKGKKHTEETKKKMRDAKKRELKSRFGINNPNYGRVTTEELKEKMSRGKELSGTAKSFYRISQNGNVKGPFINIARYGRDNGLRKGGIQRSIDDGGTYKGYAYCNANELEKRLEKIKNSPSYWRYAISRNKNVICE